MTAGSVIALALLTATPAAPPTTAPEMAAERAAAPGTPLGRALRSGCLAQARVAAFAERSDGTPLASLHPDRAMTPASTQKLLTAAAVLERFGPAHRFRTRFLSTGSLDEEGVLQGDLVVRGDGAPDLTAAELWTAVRELRAAGLRGVRGRLVGDDGAHEPPGPPPGAGARDDNPYNVPVGALMVNWNAVRVDVRPGEDAGRAARVSLFPLETVARVESNAGTGSRGTLRIGRHVVEGDNVIRVRGSAARLGRPVRRWVGLVDPTGTFLAGLEELLGLEGIAVEGGWGRGSAPPGAAELYAHPSRPLGELVRLMNKHSNNVMAETLLRNLGADGSTGPGTTEGGLAAVRALLAAWQVPAEGVRLVDGSGLSRENRITARTLTGLLRAAATEPRVGPELLASLPVAGVDGTLEDRPVGAPEGSIRAKTGSLNGVHALAGYALVAGEGPVAFAVLIEDGGSCGRPAAVAALDRAAGALAELARGETRPAE